MTRWSDRFTTFLKQGMTPDKLALSVSLGMVLGIFPALGTTTLLCGLVGLLAGLNQPAIQSVNYLVYPLQILLLIPLYRLGEFLFQAQPLPLSYEEIRLLVDQGALHAIKVLWTTTWHAIVGWMLIAPFITGVLYVVLRGLFRRLARTISTQ